MAAVTAILWLGRLALKFWIDGPEVQPSSEPWPPVPAGEADGFSRARR